MSIDISAAAVTDICQKLATAVEDLGTDISGLDESSAVAIAMLHSLRTALDAANARAEGMRMALAPLKQIADEYDANALDDEARRFWGPEDARQENSRSPEDIELYAGRGGKRLLTLADCFVARAALAAPAQEVKPAPQKDPPAYDETIHGWKGEGPPPPRWTAPDGTIVYRSYGDYCDD